MKNTKNTKLVGFEPMSKAETEKVVGGTKGHHSGGLAKYYAKKKMQREK